MLGLTLNNASEKGAPDILGYHGTSGINNKDLTTCADYWMQHHPSVQWLLRTHAFKTGQISTGRITWPLGRKFVICQMALASFAAVLLRPHGVVNGNRTGVYLFMVWEMDRTLDAWVWGSVLKVFRWTINTRYFIFMLNCRSLVGNMHDRRW